MIRLILVGLAAVFIAICTLFVFPISRLVGLFNRRGQDVISLRFVQFAMRLCKVLCGAKIEYIGLENLPPKGKSVVYISNHRGFFDIIATYPIFPDLTGFVAKEEMRKWPLIGWWMTSVYCLFLNRKDRRKGIATILEGVEYVKKSISMWIFPEGTRSKKEGEMLPFKHGSFILATKAGAPIVPVALNGSGKIFDDHVPKIIAGKVRVEFLPPIETAGMTREEISELPDKVHAMIEEKVKAHANL